MKSIARYVLTAFVIAGLVILPTAGVTGCNASQFETVLNEVGPAIGTILQIIALVRGGTANPSLSPKVSADLSGPVFQARSIAEAHCLSSPGLP